MVYDYDNERKIRIWQRFWKGFFKSTPGLEECAERLQEMIDIFTKLGISEFKNRLIPPNHEIAQARKMAQFLEGPDVYFKSKLEQKNYWGHLCVQSFPFQASICYDVSKKVVIIDGNDILQLYEQNFKDHKIFLGRKFRQMLRCLDGERVNFSYTTNIPSSCICSADKIVHFSSGILRVKKWTEDRFAGGFEVTLELDDGEEEGQNCCCCFKRYTCTIGHKELGITKCMKATEPLKKLLNDPDNQKIIQSKWSDYIERLQWMHQDLEEERREKEDLLSTAFMLCVYANHHLSREELDNYILKYEQNENLHKAYKESSQYIDALYQRLSYFDAHPALSLWYCFWDDIAVKNSIIKEIGRYPDLFDMSRPTAFAYYPMEIKTLKEKLQRLKLRKSNGKGLFKDSVLDLFEKRLEAETKKEPIPEYNTKITEMSSSLLVDSCCISVPLITENTTYVASAALVAFNSIK